MVAATARCFSGQSSTKMATPVACKTNQPIIEMNPAGGNFTRYSGGSLYESQILGVQKSVQNLMASENSLLRSGLMGHPSLCPSRSSRKPFPLQKAISTHPSPSHPQQRRAFGRLNPNVLETLLVGHPQHDGLATELQSCLSLRSCIQQNSEDFFHSKTSQIAYDYMVKYDC